MASSSCSDRESPIQQETTIISKTEQEFWTEIIDESQVLPSFDRRPVYGVIAPYKRRCCDLGGPRDLSCSKCGFSGWHALASTGQLDGQLDGDGFCKVKKDKFGNTLLHYAAGSGYASRKLVSLLVSQGFDIRAKNVSGQNF